jgi:hypothetical protein
MRKAKFRKVTSSNEETHDSIRENTGQFKRTEIFN